MNLSSRGARALRRLAVAGLLLASCAAQAQGAAIRIDQPSEPLDKALNQLAREAGVQILFASKVASDKTAPALQGTFTVREALDRLLAGSGLSVQSQDNQTFTIVPAPPAATGEGATVLPEIQVVESVISESTENTGSYAAARVAVGGKTARDPKQIQQSVSVVTAQRIQDQALTTAEEALGQATGVTLTKNASYSSNAIFTARGFDMGLQYDGGAAGVNYFWYHTGLPDLATLERVEVLRGSDGLFAGSGNPGGTVNLVRKRPLKENQVVVDLVGGSWDRFRTQIDATGPLGWDGKLRGRVVAAQEDREFFYDTAALQKSVVFGVLELDVRPGTMLSLGGSYEKQDLDGLYYGLPRYADGRDLKLSRKDCLCTDWSGRHDVTREAFAKLSQAIGSNWNLRVNFTRQLLDYDYTQGNATGAVNPATGEGAQLVAGRTDVSNFLNMVDVMVDGRFTVLGFEQELLIGADWQDMFSDGDGVAFYNSNPDDDVPPPPAVDVFNFDPSAVPQPGVPASYGGIAPFGGQKQKGVYALLRTDWLPVLHTAVGVRNSSYDYNYPPFADYNYKESGVNTPYAGVSYDVTSAVTLYGSYARIYKSQAGFFTPSEQALKPIHGNTYEVGAKGAWVEGKLTAALALYQIERKNEAVYVGPLAGNLACCFLAAGEIESRGVDLEVTGQVTQGWQLSAGYSYNKNKQESGYGDGQDGITFSPQTPKHLLKLWTMAQLRGAWSDVRLGGGMNWQSKNYVSGSAGTYNPETNEFDGDPVPFRYTQKSYATVDLRGDYRLNQTWSAGLNVNNLFDEKYYETVSTSNMGNYYGEPRHVLLSVKGRW